MTTQNCSIFDFLSHFSTGIARQNRYRVEFRLPKGVNLAIGDIGVNPDATAGKIQGIENFFNAKGGVNIKCHTCQMPDRTMLTQDIKQNSAPFRVPYSASYMPVTFSFYTNSEMDAKDYFEVWQSAVVNLGTNTLNFYDEYVSDVKIYALDVTGQDAYSVTLYEAWPLTVGTTDFSYAAMDQVISTTVTMTFKSWAPMYNESKNASVPS